MNPDANGPAGPDRATHLVTVTGRDRPGIAASLFAAADAAGLEVLDVEQLHVHGRLLLCVLVDRPEDPCASAPALSDALANFPDVHVSVEPLPPAGDETGGSRQLVTVLGRLGPGELQGAFAAVTSCGANVDRVVRLASYPVSSYELTVSGGDPGDLRRAMAATAARLGIDVAVQPAGLHRRAKHLIVMDVDSTLVQGEVVDLLAARAGRGEEVARITAAAMAGELDFETALRSRVAQLAGLPAAELEAVGRALRLAPGARTLVRTLRRLGYATAVVSGGFTQVIEPLVRELGIDHVAANVLEVHGDRLTGGLVGPVVDRAGKADALVRFAAEEGVPLARTVAVGDGANDMDMLARAGLGIAYNAKPVLREVADTALNVPYLDAVLFLLGIPRHEVEAADADG